MKDEIIYKIEVYLLEKFNYLFISQRLHRQHTQKNIIFERCQSDKRRTNEKENIEASWLLHIHVFQLQRKMNISIQCWKLLSMENIFRVFFSLFSRFSFIELNWMMPTKAFNRCIFIHFETEKRFLFVFHQFLLLKMNIEHSNTCCVCVYERIHAIVLHSCTDNEIFEADVRCLHR